MLNRTSYLLVYLVLYTATLSASSLHTNSLVKINTAVSYGTCQCPWEASKVADYTGSGTIVITKEFLIRFGFAVHYYA